MQSPGATLLADLGSSLSEHDPTGLARLMFDHVIGPVIVIATIWVAGRLVQRVTTRAMETARADAQVRTLVNNVIGVLSLVLAVLSGLTTAGLNISVLLTFGGLFSLAVGFALQDLLRNILAGIFLLLERPFRIGDLITVGEEAGVVQAIHLRTTQLRTPDGRMAILPNLAAFNAPVINGTAYRTRRYELALWIPAGADVDRAMGVVQRELQSTAPLRNTDPPPLIIPKVDVDGGNTLLQIRYWLDYRLHDPDVVTADLARRLKISVGATVEQAEAAADDEPQLPPLFSPHGPQDDGSDSSTGLSGASSESKRLRRRIPRLRG